MARFTPESLLNFKKDIITSAKMPGPFRIPQLDNAHPVLVDEVTTRALKMVTQFEKLFVRHRASQIREDTDVIWSVSAAGTFARGLDFPDSDNRYGHLNWSWIMERQRLRISFAIARQVASMRADKPTGELTNEDMLKYSPIIIYSGIPEQKENLRATLELPNYNFPPSEKVHILEDVKNPDGTFRTVRNLTDEIQSLVLPENLTTRRLVMVTTGQQAVRALYNFARFHDAIPEDTIIQPYPTRIPGKGRKEYTIQEGRGILKIAFGLNPITPDPYPYQI